jgi:outer membrane protein assembly factor BamB
VKGFLKSNMVLVITIFILLTAVALFSGNVVSTHAASTKPRISLYRPSTMSHTLARPKARPGEQSSPGTGRGQLLWRYQTGSNVDSSPAVVNGVVYEGSDDGYVYTLKASNGTLLWLYQTGSPVDASPKVVKGVVYIGSGDTYMYALKASNGTVLWRYQMGLGFGPYSRAAVVNGVVYVGSDDGYVYALTA